MPLGDSSNSEMAAANARKRLQQLMGSDEVNLSDRKFMKSLAQRIYEKKEELEREQEKVLAEEEVRRERKLLLEGILNDQGDKEQVVTKSAEKRKSAHQESHEWLNNDSIWPKSHRDDRMSYRNKGNSEQAKIENNEEEKENMESLNEEGTSVHVEQADHGENNAHESTALSEQHQSRFERPTSARVVAFENEQNLQKLYELAKEMVFVGELSKKK